VEVGSGMASTPAAKLPGIDRAVSGFPLGQVGGRVRRSKSALPTEEIRPVGVGVDVEVAILPAKRVIEAKFRRR